MNKKLIGIPLCLLSAIAQAQDNGNTSSKPRASRMLEEVVVTAQKREERMADVPITIAAFSEDALEIRGVTQAGDLEAITPSMVYDNLVGYSLIYMRGVGTEVFLPNSEPSVATYIDGIYFPMSHGLAQEFVPIQRIEVLKGPQGTLFGRNAAAGAINVISKDVSEEWTTSLDAGVGSFSRKMAKAYVSGPIIDGLAFSVSGMYSIEEPYYDIAPTSPRTELKDNESQGLNARLNWDITDRLSLILTAYDTRFAGTWTVPNTQTDPTPLGLAVGSSQARPGKRETNFNAPSDIVANTQVYGATLEYNADKFDSKLITATQRAYTDTRWDYDNGPQPAVYFYPNNQFLYSDSAEFQILSNDNSPWAGHLNWIFGLYYFDSIGGFDPMNLGVSSTASSGPLSDFLSAFYDLAAPLNLPINDQSLAAVTLRGVIDTTSYAAFAQSTIKLLDGLDLTLGVRYQTEDRELSKSSVGYNTNNFASPQEIILFDFLDGESYDISNEDISPRIAVDYELFDDTLLYASWSQAFKSGTMNVVNVYLPPSEVLPEKTTSIEIGMKGSVLDGSLKYSTAIFRNEIEDLQTLLVSVSSGGLITLVNAAQAEIQGAEFDITWQMFPELLPGFVLTAAAGYLDGEYTSFPDGNGFDDDTGVAFGNQALLGPASPPRDFSGNTTVRTPEFSGSLGLSYTMEVPGGDLEFGASTYYNSGYYFDTQNSTEQPRYQTYDARISYFHVDSGIRVTAIGKNLGDELYFANIFPNDFGEAATYAPPTAYTLLISYDL